MSVLQKHTVSHSINVARSSPKIAVVVVQEIVLMWFRSVGRVVWVGNADVVVVVLVVVGRMVLVKMGFQKRE